MIARCRSLCFAAFVSHNMLVAHNMLVTLFALVSLVVVAGPLVAAEPEKKIPPPKPVPAMQVVPQADDQASFQRVGNELTRYHFGPGLRRPYLFPLVGPSGRSVTRIGHPHDPISHSHHNSVWISHHDVDGIDFWGDRGKNVGRIVHERIEQYSDDERAASLLAFNVWKNAAGEPILQERRRVTVEPAEGNDWFTIIDLELRSVAESVTLGKTPFGLIGVRMAKTIGVHDGGGQIRNSAGGVNEAEVFWKPARWCDYSGPITVTGSEGVTLFDHPINPNHPTVFHVRDDGWMGASLTFDAPRTITRDNPLRLRYGVSVHAQMSEPEAIESRWQTFAATTPPPTLELPKKK